jgi:prepilin-type N-terminal cleavage/methylation domain-containing protein
MKAKTQSPTDKAGRRVRTDGNRRSVFGLRPPSSVLQSGFTLVEMVTVVAVIAILAGIMLGAAGAAQRKAMSSRTQATINQIGVGVEMRKADVDYYAPDFIVWGLRIAWENRTPVWPCEALYWWLEYEPTHRGTLSLPNPQPAYVKFRPDQLQDSGKTISGESANYMRVVDAWGNPINYKANQGNGYYFETPAQGETAPTFYPRHNRMTFDLCSYGANGTTLQEKDKRFDRAQDLGMGGGGSSRPPDYFFKPFNTLGGGSDKNCYGGEDGDDINNWQQRQ